MVMTSYSFHAYATDVLSYDAASGTFTLSSSFDTQTDRNLVEYTDDDSSFTGDVDNNALGDDATQVGTVYDDTGAVIGSGTIYAPTFARIIAPDGTEIDLDRIEVDGVHVGYISSAPLVPGTVYTYAWSDTVDGEYILGHDYYATHSVPCFDANTLISTPDGLRAASEILPGQKVLTLDHGAQPVQWRCERRVDLRDAPDSDFPILIAQDALGGGRPAQDLIVSPQHRILLGHASQAADYAPAQVLVPAKALVGTVPGVRIMRGRLVARWVHFACKTHQIVCANGAYAESLLFGSVCYTGLLPAQRKCLDVLAQVRLVDLDTPAARPCLGVKATQKMISRQRRRLKGYQSGAVKRYRSLLQELLER